MRKSYYIKVMAALKDHNIDDDLLDVIGEYNFFKNVGKIVSKDAQNVLFGNPFYLLNYKWNELFLNCSLSEESKKAAKSYASKKSWETCPQRNYEGMKGKIPWNKGLAGTGICKPWNKGLSKDNNASLLKMSNDRKGKNNPIHNITEDRKAEWKLKLSKTTKENILSGKFTPSSNNRNAAPIHYNDNIFRSTWELIFHYINPDYLYETLRIQYENSEGNMSTYIVDFVNHSTKHVVEVKPMRLFDYEKYKLKENALLNWCRNNGYVYSRFTESDLIININNIKDLLSTLSDTESYYHRIDRIVKELSK